MRGRFFRSSLQKKAGGSRAFSFVQLLNGLLVRARVLVLLAGLVVRVLALLAACLLVLLPGSLLSGLRLVGILFVCHRSTPSLRERQY
jgi:hypothetical protein